MKRILTLRSSPSLNAAAGMGDMPLIANLTHLVDVKGVNCDESFAPVAFPTRRALPQYMLAAEGFTYRSLAHEVAYIVRADIDDLEALNRLKSDCGDVLLGVHADLRIHPCTNTESGDQGKPIGDANDVLARVGVEALRSTGLTGSGIPIVVVDTGIDGTRVAIAGGWSIDGKYKPGSATPWHGTMVAFDAKLLAPDAQLLDYALLRSTAGTWAAFLSDAIAAYSAILKFVARHPGPLVVNNSWALYDRSQDAPIGSPENYSANPEHPFCEIVGTLVAAGCDVVFAAGNCGLTCPFGNCGSNDRGSGKSIHGANSHPDVITVAAVDIKDKRLCFSSQGPGGIYPRKPDVAAFSQFSGSGVMAADTGTSAAAPLVSGLLAALRQHPKLTTASPAVLKGLLQRTARDTSGTGWTYDLGYGIVDAVKLLENIPRVSP